MVFEAEYVPWEDIYQCLSWAIVLLTVVFASVYIWRILFGSTQWSELCVTQYTYEGPRGIDDWPLLFGSSISSFQSPVSLSTAEAIRIKNQRLLYCQNFSVVPVRLQIHNEGHTVWMLGRWYDGTEPQVSGGPLRAVYKFHSIAFRWGPGSEHVVNNKRYAMEVQVIFLREDIRNLSEATTYGRRDTVVILSYVYQETTKSNQFLHGIVESLPAVTSPGSWSDLQARPLCWIAPPFAREYLFYRGSLTFPPCSEVAMWIIHPEPLNIHKKQLDKFDCLRNNSGNAMTFNSRPVQNLNKREVYYYS